MSKSTAFAGDAPPGAGPCSRACDGRDARLSVAMCPPDGGIWPTFTCALGFAAAMILDGVCFSLFAYDGRVGVMDEQWTPAVLEHLAVVWLCRYLIEPFSCAYINRYGFRYCLFFGGVLSVAWIALVQTSFIGNAEPSAAQHFRFVLAAVGGIGIGMIKTAFAVLIASLFIANRKTAQMCLHMGSFAGMLILPALTAYLILNVGRYSSMYLLSDLTGFTLTFWLLVATPVPLQVCGETYKENNNSPQPSGGIVDTPAVANTKCGVFKMLLSPFTVKMPLYISRSSTTISLNANWTSESNKHRLVCTRNLTNMFDDRIIGARPMYRQDILFNSNGMFLANNLKTLDCRYVKITSNLTVDDLNEEKDNRFNFCSIAVSQVLRSMFNVSIWLNGKFIVFAASEALIYGSSLIPLLFVNGTVGQKSSDEVMVTLIVAGLGLLAGCGIGFLLHETSSTAVPLRHVSLVLITNGLALLLCRVTDDFAKILPIFGYYKSIQNAVFHHYIFPLRKLINIRGQIALVRAVSRFVGLLTAITILKRTSDVGCVYAYAGLLVAAGGLCLGLLEWVSKLRTNVASDESPLCPNIVINLQDVVMKDNEH